MPTPRLRGNPLPGGGSALGARGSCLALLFGAGPRTSDSSARLLGYSISAQLCGTGRNYDNAIHAEVSVIAIPPRTMGVVRGILSSTAVATARPMMIATTQ